jgi:hypothetical protein
MTHTTDFDRGKYDWGGEGQEQLQTTDPSSRQRERPTWTNPQPPDGNKNLILSPRRGLALRQTGRLTVGRNISSRVLIEWDESYSYEKWEAGSWGRGQLGNPEEGERPQLEAATKQRLVKNEKILCVPKLQYRWSV